MKKQGKNSVNWIVIAVAAVALFSLVAIAYAKENDSRNHMPRNGSVDVMGGKDMDAMHKQMTKNLDPETRGQTDKMRGQCAKLHEGETFEEGMMQ